MKKLLLILVVVALTCHLLPGLAAALPNGTYSGQAEGFSVETPIVVTVTLVDETITTVMVIGHDESVDIIPAVAQALIEVPARIVAANSTDVDVTVGATWTSKGLIAAVKDALTGDSIAPESQIADPTPAQSAAESPPEEAMPESDVEILTFDFKQFRWGDSMETVRAVEGEPYLSNHIKERNTDYIAYKTKAVGLDMVLVYYFTEDQLFQVRYILDEDHSNENLFIKDYETFRDALTKKYGKPLIDTESWQDDSKKDFYKNRKGDALSYGYLTYYTWYFTDRSIITMQMDADNYKVSMIVEYVSNDISPGEADYSGDI